MNKRERRDICALLAEWEFGIIGGGSSEAAARASCCLAIRKLFQISEEDMAFDRAWQIAGIVGDRSDEFMDLLVDAIERDFEGVVDALDDGVGCLKAMLEAANQDSPHPKSSPYGVA